MPRVTIITATYNWAPVLPYAIATVLGQTFSDFEHLVVGDGCTDDSAEVVARAAGGDPRVRWFNLESNTGHQAGPNAEGLRQARGDLIAYLGHDDLWLPRHLELLVAAIDAEPDVAVVHATTLMVRPDQAPFLRPADGWVYRPPAWIPPTTVVHRREPVLEVGGWRPPSPDDSADPDAELWARVAARAPVRWVPRVTSVKLPASLRRDVYRTRPVHEQAYWLDRIRAAPDPEADLVAASNEPYALGLERRERWTTGTERWAWGVRIRVRRLLGRPTMTSAERHRVGRRFKGLEP